MAEDILDTFARIMATSFLPIPPRIEAAPAGDYDVFSCQMNAAADDDTAWRILRAHECFPRAVAYTLLESGGTRTIEVYAAKLLQ